MKSEVFTLTRTLETDVLLQVLFTMAEHYPQKFEELMLQHSPDKVIVLSVPNSKTVIKVSKKEFDVLTAYGRAGDKKVTGIKYLREVTNNLALKEAKDLFEEVFESQAIRDKRATERAAWDTSYNNRITENDY